MNSASLSIISTITSGSELMCSFKVLSPNARDIANCPSTLGTFPATYTKLVASKIKNTEILDYYYIIQVLPILFVTKPPLSSIVLRSFIGSWSTDNWRATPPSQITARESPTFPTTSFSPLISITVTAVEPPLFLTSRLFLFKILLSVLWYALLIAVSVSFQKSGWLHEIKILSPNVMHSIKQWI